jgi:5-formyltetrahydrofolate cyclo-ligase
VCTPDESVVVADPPPPPGGIDWSRVDEAMLEAMPVLADLRRSARNS